MKKALSIALASTIALTAASPAEAKRGGKGKGGEVRACMVKKGVTKADRGTAKFRVAARACGAGKRGR